MTPMKVTITLTAAVVVAVILALIFSPGAGARPHLNGPASVYGGIEDVRSGLDNNRTCTHLKNEDWVGIATRFHSTKRGWWWLYQPGVKRFGRLVRDIECGPAEWTGRVMDLNRNAAKAMGFPTSDRLFPTGIRLKAVYLSRNPVVAAEMAFIISHGLTDTE